MSTFNNYGHVQNQAGSQTFNAPVYHGGQTYHAPVYQGGQTFSAPVYNGTVNK